MRIFALAISLLASTPAFGSVLYTFTETWTDHLPTSSSPAQQYSLGFTYESPDFFAGGTLTRDQVSNCAGWPYDFESRCGGGILTGGTTGVGASLLLESYLGGNPPSTGWSDPEPSGIAALFPGTQLDQLGTWTVSGLSIYGIPGYAFATLSISNTPEPASIFLLASGAAFVAIRRKHLRRREFPR